MKVCLSVEITHKVSQAWLGDLRQGSNHIREDRVSINKLQIRYAGADFKKKCNITHKQTDRQAGRHPERQLFTILNNISRSSHLITFYPAGQRCSLFYIMGYDWSDREQIQLLFHNPEGFLSQIGLCRCRRRHSMGKHRKHGWGNLHKNICSETCKYLLLCNTLLHRLSLACF